MTSFIQIPGEPAVPLTIMYSLYSNDTTARTTGGIIPIWPGSFSFAIVSDYWPFKEPGNTLSVSMTFSSSTSNLTSFGQEPSYPDIFFVTVLGTDDDIFFLRLPKLGIFDVNGTVQQTPVDLDMATSTNSRNSISVTVVLPTFDTAFYDGVVAVDQTAPWLPFSKGRSVGISVIIFLALSGGFLLLFGLISVIFHLKGKEAKRSIRYS